MPAVFDQAVVLHRLHLSRRALVLCGVCAAATLFGAFAITVSFSLVVAAHAASPAWWLAAAVLLAHWFATLFSMYGRALATLRGDAQFGAAKGRIGERF